MDAGSGHLSVVAALGASFSDDADLRTSATGTLYVWAQGGSVSFGADSDQRADAAIAVRASQNILLGGELVSGAAVSLWAENGWIRDALSDGAVDVEAVSLVLEAASGIGRFGADLKALELEVVTVSARSVSGGIHLRESDDLVVGDSTVTVQQVGVGAALSSRAHVGNGLGTGSGSPVVVVAQGSLSLEAGASAADGSAAELTGVSDLRLEAISGTVSVLADVLSGGGNITIEGELAVSTGELADVRTSGVGALTIESRTGEVSFGAGSEQSSGSGVVVVRAATNILLGATLRTAGDAQVVAGGWIRDRASDTVVDIEAMSLQVEAGYGFGELGAGANAVETTVGILSARVGAGGLHLVESDSMIVGDTVVTPVRVGLDGISRTEAARVFGDLVSTAEGSLVLRTLAGDLVVVDGSAPVDAVAVRADGGGNILMEAVGAGTSISLIADVRSTSGSISIVAAQNVSTVGSASIRTGGAGSIEVEAVAGSVTLSTASDQIADSGDIRLAAGQNVTLGGVARTSGTVSVVATAGWIRDGDADGSVDIEAAALRFEAGRWVGQLGANDNAIETTVVRLTGVAGHEGITILESDALEVNTVTVTVNRVGSDAATTALSDATLAEVTTLGNGSIVLRTVHGDILLNGGEPAAVRAVGPAIGDGHILLQAQGEDSSIYINRDVISDSGDITVLADLNVEAAQTASVSTGLDGSVEVVALNGSIEFGRDSQIRSSVGDIELVAANNIGLGGQLTTNATVALIAESGSIADIFLDGTIVVQAGALMARAGLSIGNSSNTMGIDVDRLTVLGERGGVYLSERRGLVVVDQLQWQVNRVGADALLLPRVSTSAFTGIVSASNLVIEVQAGMLDIAAPIEANGAARLELGFGAIIDSFGGATDLRARSLEVVAHAVGNVANALEIEVGRLDAVATRGGLFLDNTGALEIEAASASAGIEIVSTGTLTVGGIATPATARLESTNGAIVGSGAPGADITAAVAELSARSGIGGTGAADLDLSVGQLVLTNTGTGSAYLSLQGATTIASAELAGPGNLYLRAEGGTLHVAGVISLYQGAVRAKVDAALSISGELLASGDVQLLAREMTITAARLFSGNGELVLRASGSLQIDAQSSLEAPNGEVTTISPAITSGATISAGLRVDLRAAETLATVPERLSAPKLRLSSSAGSLNRLAETADWFSYQFKALTLNAFDILLGTESEYFINMRCFCL